MKVNLSIVGFYFGIDVEVNKGATIADVMIAAEAQSRGKDAEFHFTPTPTGTLSNVTILHRKEAKSRNSKRTYPKGIYSLTDDAATGNPSLVWQYYLFDAGDERREKRGSEVPFQKNTTKLNDGDKVIWRAVAICTGPTTAASTKEKLIEHGGSY
ncbi:MAG: hypothetical protein AAFZ11_07180, partial [Pseudomonadota bacterium]